MLEKRGVTDITFLTLFLATLPLEPLTNFGVRARVGTPPTSGGEGLRAAHGGRGKLNPTTQWISTQLTIFSGPIGPICLCV